jgi:hypothetical protein
VHLSSTRAFDDQLFICVVRTLLNHFSELVFDQFQMTAVLLLACLSLFVLVQEGDSRSAHIEQHVPANMLAGQCISSYRPSCAGQHAGRSVYQLI